MSTPIEMSALRRSLSNLTPSIEIGAAALASLLLLAVAQGAPSARNVPSTAGGPASGRSGAMGAAGTMATPRPWPACQPP